MYPTKEICKQFSDRDLIQQSIQDVLYFSCLYDRYEERLLNYVERMGLVTHEEAQDILQEVFVKIWKNLNAFDTNMKLSSWIYRIAHNQAVSCLRKKKSFGKDRKVILDDTSLPNIVDNQADAPQVLEGHSLQIYKILNKMPLKYKEVLVLKFLENMSYEEISDILKIPEGTVATRINRAKKTFRKLAKGHSLAFNQTEI